MRSGIDPYQIVKQMKGIRCPNPKMGPVGMTEEQVLSCPDGMARALERYLEGKPPSIGEEQTTSPSLEFYDDKMFEEKDQDFNEGVIVGVCPECGNSLIYQDGCSICHSCYYSKCS
jgi:ribonucleoside-diphosphate reductase alpha chain